MQTAPVTQTSIVHSLIVEYHTMQARVEAVLKEFQGVVIDVSTTKGLEEARKARAELRSCRLDMETLRTDIKAPILERGRLIDSEAKRIILEVETEEASIDKLIKAEEVRKEAEKAEIARLEKARVAGIQARITALRNIPLSMMSKSASELLNEIHKVENFDISTSFEEFFSEAAIVHTYVVEKLQEMYQSKKEEEDQRAEIAAEIEKLKQERIAQAVREAAVVDAQRKAQEELDALSAQMSAEREAHESAMKDQQVALQAQIKALDAAASVTKKPVLSAVSASVSQIQSISNPAANIALQNNLLIDAYVDLSRFVTKYDGITDLKPVIIAANAFIADHEGKQANILLHYPKAA